ncbi:hypothetical protein K488DRAFT_89868 [Vararia minispora EC-137]|uniref:Uncharacterized protein n=1 Tax=Vararia minispora EC-137 TaxID=1314806 RepID=A0ACB8Q9A3_9AGAM|nr:hypothetical protein K488DRAFT_89868 [Vararia minispora EC-137]
MLPAPQPPMRPGVGQRSHTVPRPTISPLKIAPDTTKRRVNRWSELVPPQTALTFVAMYDPSEGLIGFSGSSLLPFDAVSGGAPKPSAFPQDGQSEVLTIDGLGAATPAQSTAAMTSDTALRDMQAMLGAYFRGETHQSSRDALFVEQATPRVSSTLEGMYSERPTQPVASHMLLELVEDALADDSDDESINTNDFVPCTARSSLDSVLGHDSGYGSAGEDTVDARTVLAVCPPRPVVDSFFVDDDSSYNRPNERSAFSVTTTSTSSYIDVKTPSTAEFLRPRTPTPYSQDQWPLLDQITEMEMDSLNVLAYLQPRPKTPNKRFRKASTVPSSPASQRSTKRLWQSISNAALSHSQPASPSDVLARETYNHSWDDGDGKPPSPSRPRLRGVLSKRFLRLKKGANDSRWVVVEIEQRVTQHDLHDDDM